MLTNLWVHFLYQPLLNFILILYDGPASENMGVAVILLTLIFRSILLPFTILSRRSPKDQKILETSIEAIERDFVSDPVAQKEEIRELLRQHQINPFIKSITFAAQAIVLVVLYQVFVGGFKNFNITSTAASFYPWVTVPDFVNIHFLGANILEKNIWWAGAVAMVFYLEILFEQRGKKALLLQSDIVYRYLLPITMFIVLSWLPMAKSLFILTSIIFSFIIASIMKLRN